MTAELKPLPCPFCGQELELVGKQPEGDYYQHPYPYGNEPRCVAKDVGFWTDDPAAAAWNTRPEAEPAPAGEVEPVAWQRRIRNTEVAADHPFAQWSKWKEVDLEKVTYAQKVGGVAGFPEFAAEVRPLYTAPPAIGLTKEEIAQAVFRADPKMAMPTRNERLAFEHGKQIAADAILSRLPASPGGGDELEWFGKNRGLELSFTYLDAEIDDYAWCVHQVSGGVNDRGWTLKWTLIGSGPTPAEAIKAARQKLEPASQEPGQ